MSLDSWLSPRFLFPALLLVGGVVGGLLGWWLRVTRERTRRCDSDAFESEVVRAARLASS